MNFQRICAALLAVAMLSLPADACGRIRAARARGERPVLRRIVRIAALPVLLVKSRRARSSSSSVSAVAEVQLVTPPSVADCPTCR